MKYAALMLNSLALALLLWGLLSLRGLLGAPARLPVAPSVELKPLSAQFQSDQKKLVEVQQSIAQFQRQLNQPADPMTSNLTALLALPPSGAPGAASPNWPQRSLTVLAQSGDDHFAMLDGRVVRVGSRLSGGGRVIKVSNEAVVIAERKGRRTLKMPLRQLRVGSLGLADYNDVAGVVPTVTQTQGARP